MIDVRAFVDRRIALGKELDGMGAELKHAAYVQCAAGTITESQKADLLEQGKSIIRDAGDLLEESEDELTDDVSGYLQNLDDATMTLRERTNDLVTAVSLTNIAAGLVNVSGTLARFFANPSAAGCVAIAEAIESLTHLGPTVPG